MATYVNNLRLTELATGEGSGTWGTTTNTNLELIGEALGYGSEAIANASTHTITVADGTADSARSFYLKLTGGGQACTVTLAPNTLSKVWMVENTTNSTLTFSQGSGANVAVPAGQVKMIATDGAGSGAVVYDLLVDTDLTGTTTVVNLTASGTVDAAAVEFDSLSGTGAVAVTDILDQDDMSSNSATALATQQSIKAYVDSQVGTVDTWAEVLANGATSGSTNPEVTAGQALKTNTVNETSAGSGVTIDSVLLKDGGATLTSALTGTTGDLRNTSSGAETTALSLRNYAAGADTATALNFFPTQSTSRFASIVSENVDGNNNINLSFLTSAGDTPTAALVLNQDRTATFNSSVTIPTIAYVGTSIVHQGDANTSIDFATDTMTHYTGGLRALDLGATFTVFNTNGADVDFRVESDNNANMLFVDGGNDRVGVGTTTRANLSTSVGSTAALQVEGLTAANSSASVIRNANSVNGPYLSLGKSRGTGLGGTTIVQSGDQLGVISFLGSDGTDLEIGAQIIGTVNGTPGANDMPGALAFLTTADGAVTPSERMTISSSGAVTINGGLTVGTGVVAQDLTLSDNTPTISMTDTDSNADALIFTDGGTGTGALFISADHNDEAAGSYISLKVDSAELAQLKASEVIFNEDSRNQDFRVESDSNTHALFVDAGNNRVGVFTSSPAAPLDIQFGDNANILRGSYASGEDNFFLELDSAIVASGVVGYQFHLKNNGTAYNNTLTLDRGNVGIGVQSADEILHVEKALGTTLVKTEVAANSIVGFEIKKTGATTSNWRIVDGAVVNGQIEIWDQTNSRSVFNADSTEIVINDTSANLDFRVESDSQTHMLFVDAGNNRVGVGTSAPTELLEVFSETASTAIEVSAGKASTTTGESKLVLRALHSSSGTSYARSEIASLGTAGGDVSLIFRTTSDVSGPQERLRITDSGDVIVNQDGNNSDFRVESDANSHALFVDASTNEVGMFTSSGGDTLTVYSSGANKGITIHNGGSATHEAPRLRFIDGGNSTSDISVKSDNFCFSVYSTTNAVEIIGSSGLTKLNSGLQSEGGAVFNDNSADADFRVESDSNTHMIFVDASTNKVGINASAPEATLDVKTDLAITEAAAANATSQLNFYSRFSDSQRGFVVLKAESLSSGSSDLVINARHSFTDAERLRLASTGDVTFTGDLVIPNKIMHAGDTSNYMQFHQADGWRIVNSGGERFHIEGNQAVFNHDGHDQDFRVESDSNTHAIYVDGGNNSVTLGSSSSASNTIRTQSTAGFQASTDGSFGTTKTYTFRDGVGIDNPNASSYSTATAAVLCVGAMSTGRSINATGTVNASGADYAEYEANNGLVISKGSIVGFKTDGTLTLTFSEAVRFAVKSTDPAYVGGDTWSDVEPPEKNTAAWDTWFAETEAKRAKVDRVAYSGKVPVNVQGATAGQYIIAVANSSGEITGQAVTDPDFSQYKLSVGRVNRILEDGRAELAVIIH